MSDATIISVNTGREMIMYNSEEAAENNDKTQPYETGKFLAISTETVKDIGNLPVCLVELPNGVIRSHFACACRFVTH